MSKVFQTAVRSNVRREKRYAAIDRLAGEGDRTSLEVLVRTGGLHGEFRRYALDALGDCNASDALADLAGETALEPSLRRRADELE
ncbi:hypothetical protein [Natrialbaceae archaeon AArc-T1-2]|uniref:hypothetical protein n=1 Tax=Natrialbaceae archaeon AArc-T1-2 TaxID=3053904 RepID=UPI00255A8D74|nr:hypothetical protein [Natrialbaceae archaeon AArc-T1-2]WIV66838.1 hypothetical protein QQ977_14255 [Natrialbaceae archaeon AArc-T1-2]